ncbi:YbaB/EbfC family nucleoid-associated protein [Rhizobium johnstonii]
MIEGNEQAAGRATSPRGEVTVTVSASGRICEVHISEDAVGLGEQRLAELIARAQRSAVGNVGR